MMIELLKEVGRGKRGARDLTYEEAFQAAELMLDGKATAAQTGAFLVAERIKMESDEELRAFVDALSARALRHPIPGSLDCAGPYDGRIKSFLATLPTAFVLCACGLPTTLHGSPSLPPKHGVTVHDLIVELGVDTSREKLIAGANRSGFLFVPTEEWCPPLKRLRSLREELSMRTVFNSAEKLIGFSSPESLAIGVYHGTVFEKMANLLDRLGYKRGIVIQGMEGSEDLSIEKRTRTLRLQNGHMDLYIVDPDVLDMQSELPAMDWTVNQQKQTMLAVLRGDADPAWSNLVLLNSAVRLWISGAAGSLEEGIDRSRRALQQGTAMRYFLKWVEAVRQTS